MLLLLAYGLSDKEGNLPKVNAQWLYSESFKDIDELVVKADGIAVEIAGSLSTRKVTASLYGEGYNRQQANVYQKGRCLYVTLPPQVGQLKADGGSQLTLRIVVPKKIFHQITAELPSGNLYLQNLRMDKLVAEMDNGCFGAEELDLKAALLDLAIVDVQWRNSSINVLDIALKKGDVELSRSQVRAFTYNNERGNLRIAQKKLKGIYDLKVHHGDIVIITNRTPYDLLCDLAAQWGAVQVDYQKYDWAELKERNLTAADFLAVNGEGRASVKARSDDGDIRLILAD